MKQAIITEEIAALLHKPKGICISIIVPAHRLSPERRTDRERLEKAIQRAKGYLMANYSQDEIKPLVKAIDELYSRLDFNHNEEGIGLFVAPGIRQLVQFFFPVKEKVMVGESFDIRDLLYQEYYAGPYIVLMLNEKEARLFQARSNALEEVHDARFPKKHEAQYEYQRPVYGSANGKNAFTKSIEKDKSQLEEIRYESFLKLVDDALSNYVTGDTPLIITGAQKDLAYFNKVTRHVENIAGLLPGNYAHLSINELGKMTWNIMKSFLNVVKQKEIGELEGRTGNRNCLTGILDIWEAVQEGRGLKLLVEKDYAMAGFLKKDNDYQLYLHPPKEPHRILPDAINSLIETVLEKNGKVILLENKSLQAYQRMALVTRY